MATAVIDPTTGLPRINQLAVPTPASAVATPASVINPNTPVPTLATNTVTAPAVPATPAWTPTPGVVRIDRGNATSYANANSGLEYGDTGAALQGGPGGTRPAWATDAVLSGGSNPAGAPLGAPANANIAVPNSQGILGMPEGAGGSYSSLTPPGASTAAIPGAPGNLTNPFAAASAGFDRQGQNAQGYMRQALDYIDQGTDIFDRATRARAITGILGATAGPNNAGAVYGQGADTLNSGIASNINAATGAGATIGASTIQAGASTANNANTNVTSRQNNASEIAARAKEPKLLATRFNANTGINENVYGVLGDSGASYVPATGGAVAAPSGAGGYSAAGRSLNRANGTGVSVDGKNYVVQNNQLVPAP